MIDNEEEMCKALCQLIETQMALKPGRVWIYDQKVNIPVDDGLFANVACLRSKPFGSALDYETDATTDALIEVQSQNTQETYRVLLWSKDSSARQRKHELTFVMHSTLAQQMQEQFAFRIGYIAPVQDISHVDGAARLNRYSLTFNLTRAYTRRKSIEYFDSFPAASPKLTIEP